MTSWENEPGTSVAEQMGPNCSSSMSLPHYSEDTFTSVSEEEEEDERPYEDDPFESYDPGEESEEPAASGLTESGWQSSCQKDEDSAFRGEPLTRKWINLLKGNRSITDRAKPSMEPDIAFPGISELSEDESGALQSFCASRISHLYHRKISEPWRRSGRKKLRPRTASRRPLTDNCAAPSELVNRLHLKSLQGIMGKIAETEMHQPSQCPFCMKKRAEFAKVEFLRRKKTILDNVLLEEKLEDFMYTKDSLTLIGEIHKSLPRLSEDPSNIWQELNKRGRQE